jgi:hypothetical protein
MNSNDTISNAVLQYLHRQQPLTQRALQQCSTLLTEAVEAYNVALDNFSHVEALKLQLRVEELTHLYIRLGDRSKRK